MTIQNFKAISYIHLTRLIKKNKREKTKKCLLKSQNQINK